MTNDAEVLAAEMQLATHAGQVLEKAYPGHLWSVTCSHGIMDVQNMALSGQYGVRLHLRNMVGPTFDKIVRNAGGELLEQYNVSRGRGGPDQALEILWAS